MKIILENNEQITKEQLIDLIQILHTEAKNGGTAFDRSRTSNIEPNRKLSLVVISETDTDIWNEHKDIMKRQGREIRTEDDIEEFYKMYSDIVRAKAHLPKFKGRKEGEV